MNRTVQLFSDSLIGIKIGTVTSSVVDSVKVPYYGQQTPIKHLAQTGKVQNSVFIDPYDPSILDIIVGALTHSGFSSYKFSKTRILVNVPIICGEEKEKIAKYLNKLAEDARISIRNIRKVHRQKLKKEEVKQRDGEIQDITNQFISEIDSLLNRKIEEL